MAVASWRERELNEQSGKLITSVLPVPDDFADGDWLKRIRKAQQIREEVLAAREAEPPVTVPMRRPRRFTQPSSGDCAS